MADIQAELVEFISNGINEYVSDSQAGVTVATPLNAGKVYFGETGEADDDIINNVGAVQRTIWQDAQKVATHSQPVNLNANGQAEIYADSTTASFTDKAYKVVITNSSDDVVMSRDGLSYFNPSQLFKKNAIAGDSTINAPYSKLRIARIQITGQTNANDIKVFSILHYNTENVNDYIISKSDTDTDWAYNAAGTELTILNSATGVHGTDEVVANSIISAMVETTDVLSFVDTYTISASIAAGQLSLSFSDTGGVKIDLADVARLANLLTVVIRIAYLTTA